MRSSAFEFLSLASASVVAVSVSAMSVQLQSPVPSAFADTEAMVATEIVVERNVTLTAAVCFEASPTNCVLLAFGRDSNMSGSLEWSESELKIGWDAGEWVVSSPITGETLAATPRSPNARKTFALAIHVRADGSASSFDVRENGTPLFADAMAVLPRMVRVDLWNCARIATRGAPSAITANTTLHRDGTMLIMR